MKAKATASRKPVPPLAPRGDAAPNAPDAHGTGPPVWPDASEAGSSLVAGYAVSSIFAERLAIAVIAIQTAN
jgi:hypothetical protein